MTTLRVRPLQLGDVEAAAALHSQVMGMEFISRYGPSFLRAYYQAWLDAPGSIAIVAADDDGDVVGALLGEVDPGVHVRWMLRHRGLRLGVLIVLRALAHPSLARDVLATRVPRYLRGFFRSFIPARQDPSVGSAAKQSDPVAVITHLMVRGDVQGLGVGRRLVDEALSLSSAAGRDMTLVTLPDLPAQHFYERLGWVPDGEVKSRSGEVFLRYRFPVDRSSS